MITQTDFNERMKKVLEEMSPIMRHISVALLTLHLIENNSLSDKDKTALWYALLRSLSCDTTQFVMQEMSMMVINTKNKTEIMQEMQQCVAEMDKQASDANNRLAKLLDELIPDDKRKDLH